MAKSINLSSTFDNSSSVNMRAAFVFVVVISVVVQSDVGHALRVQKRYDNEAWLLESAYQQQEDNKGYSAGSGLTSIARGSERTAHSEVANQHAAAQQAAYNAKNKLAQEASQAADTAESALAGKKVLYKNLEKQIEEAEEAFAEEKKQLELAESSVEAARKAADTADKQAVALADALKNANTAAEQARAAVEEAASELKSQSSMVGKAQERLNALETKWSLVEVDYEATRISALKASAAAQAARDNASLARAYANQKVEESAWRSEEKARPKYEAPSLGLYHYLHSQ